MKLSLWVVAIIASVCTAEEKNAVAVKAAKPATPVAKLLRDLKVGGNAQKIRAIQEITERLDLGVGQSPDGELLASRSDCVALLFPIMRNPFGGSLSSAAVEPLVGFARSDPSVLELFLAEVRNGTAASKVLAIRAVGKVGPDAKKSATPVLTDILKDLRLRTTAQQLVNEAAVALALIGGPYEAEAMPDIIKGMLQVKDPDLQLGIALQMINFPDVRASNLRELEFVLLRVFDDKTSKGIEMQQEVFDALAVINTPHSRKKLLILIKNGTWKERITAAKCLSKCDAPSAEEVNELVAILLSEYSPPVIIVICESLSRSGTIAAPAVPVMEKIVQDLPTRKNLDGGDKYKPMVLKALKEAIAKIKSSPQQNQGFKVNQKH